MEKKGGEEGGNTQNKLMKKTNVLETYLNG